MSEHTHPAPQGGLPMMMPARYLSIAVTLLLVFTAAACTARATVGDSVSQGPVLEVRFALGTDQCPKAVGIWLVSTPDTIQGLEIFLTWDRPDFALFAMEKAPQLAPESLKSKTGPKGSALAGKSPLVRPALERDKGLLKQWEYVQARGETGLWVKVTALAYLMSATRPRPICPGDSGPLFTIPLTLPKSQTAFVAGDSAIVRFDSLLTRGSDPQGNTLEHLVLHRAVAYVTPCRHAAQRHR